LTIDVEPDWGKSGSRAFTEVTPRFLRFLEERNIPATFFVCSDLLDVSEDIVRGIAERHEVGSHGCSHRLLTDVSRAEARREVGESRSRLARLGLEVRGFRAPFFRRRADHLALVREAGYDYDASLGSVLPGPQNARLAGRPLRRCRGGLYQFATSSVGWGLLPASLTWLRQAGAAAFRLCGSRPRLIYLHLHEFLPAATAGSLPPGLRWLLTRNCGEPAWDVLDRALEALGCNFATCSDIIDDRRESRSPA
jgi:peptidoglycan/xylan/chitin deacetylase (PgdA/CDA1 family)